MPPRFVATLAVFVIASSVVASASVRGGPYTADWASLNSRPNPRWWGDSKFHLFMHWGLYSVPSYCSPVGEGHDTCYAEWYGNYINNQESDQFKFHNNTYGSNFKYVDFASKFKAELYNPDEWADIFKRSGAKAVIMTSKHHEGFTMWPSAQSWNWNAVDNGPNRDLLGDLFTSLRKEGLKAGVYYSLYEWFHPLYNSKQPQTYVEQVMIPQMHDIAQNYQPDVFYVDGEWDHESDFWQTKPFLAWLFNESPNKENVVVNDRWGKECRGKNGGYFVCEYSGDIAGSCIDSDPSHPWTAHEGMGKSFGYNRIDQYKNETYFVHLLAQAVAHDGHLELNVGPTGDGRIPDAQKRVLLAMGDWLSVNGEAIYSTTGAPFGLKHACEDTRTTNTAGDPIRVCYTMKGDNVFAILMAWPGNEVVLLSPRLTHKTTVSMLGVPGTLKFTAGDDGVTVTMPTFQPDAVPCSHAYVLKLTGVANARKH